MWHVCELLAIVALLEVAESAINVSPHAARRAIIGFFAWIGVFALCVILLADSNVAAVTVQLGVLLLLAYMFRWFTAAVVDAVRAPQLFEPPRKSELAIIAHGLTGRPMQDCRDAAAYVLRQHDSRMALLGLIRLSEGAGQSLNISTAWLDSCEKARVDVLELLERSGGKGSTNALFLAQLLCMYEDQSVENAIRALPATALRGRHRRIKLAHRLEQIGRVRARAEEYGLPVETHAPAAEPRAVPSVPLSVRLLPGRRLASLGFRGRGMAFNIAHSLMTAYGVAAIFLGRNVWYVFLAVALFTYILALTAVGDFQDLAHHPRAAAPAEGEAT